LREHTALSDQGKQQRPAVSFPPVTDDLISFFPACGFAAVVCPQHES